jgi:hypothetical protein
LTFENLSELDEGPYPLTDLIDVDNIITERTLGTGTLWFQTQQGNNTDSPYVKIMYWERDDAPPALPSTGIASGNSQEIARIVFNAAGDGIVSFEAPSDDPVEDLGDIKINVVTSGMTTTRATVQFAVKKYGSNANVASKSIKVNKA